MVMLAFVVLGVFSHQRPKVTSSRRSTSRWWWSHRITPAPSPEIVESEVTRRSRKASTHRRHQRLTSRSYEGSAVVIIEFQLHIDGRKAAEDDARRSATIRPSCAPRSRNRACCAFDPPAARYGRWPCCRSMAARPIPPKWSPLTTWADQTLKRLENVRGVGAVTLVGATRREINIYLDPAALEGLWHHARTGGQAVRNETRTCRWAPSARQAPGAGGADRRPHAAPEDFGRIIVARKNGAPVRIE